MVAWSASDNGLGKQVTRPPGTGFSQPLFLDSSAALDRRRKDNCFCARCRFLAPVTCRGPSTRAGEGKGQAVLASHRCKEELDDSITSDASASPASTKRCARSRQQNNCLLKLVDCTRRLSTCLYEACHFSEIPARRQKPSRGVFCCAWPRCRATFLALLLGIALFASPACG